MKKDLSVLFFIVYFHYFMLPFEEQSVWSYLIILIICKPIFLLKQVLFQLLLDQILLLYANRFQPFRLNLWWCIIISIHKTLKIKSGRHYLWLHKLLLKLILILNINLPIVVLPLFRT